MAVFGEKGLFLMIQLNSFGCGLDAVTTDQVEELLKNKNKLYTVLKIDEGSNLGAAKIRIRSLKAAIDEREKNHVKHSMEESVYKRKLFTLKMKRDYTLLIPQMSPIHFQFLEPALNHSGYKVALLPSVDKHAVEEGLKYINNDACYPTIVTLGQIISTLKSGKYDLNKTAIDLIVLPASSIENALHCANALKKMAYYEDECDRRAQECTWLFLLLIDV